MKICSYFPTCNACTKWDLTYETQTIEKLNRLKNLFEFHHLKYIKKIEFLSLGTDSLRHRIDFTFQYDERLKKIIYGFYDKNHNLVSINKCLQLSKELQIIFDEFIQFDFNRKDEHLKKGSIRLRIGPDGQKGCWLDFSNIDIKFLLQDQVYLLQLIRAGYKIEIGQKGKSISVVNNRAKLSDPTPATWFKTSGPKGEELSIDGLISDFTQPSWISAIKINEVLYNWLLNFKIDSVVEFGAGLGQFSLYFLKCGYKLSALEKEKSSTISLMLNAKKHLLSERLEMLTGDFHRLNFNEQADLVFVNPARSGLRGFTNSLKAIDAKNIIYISCYPQSMCEDLSLLTESYQIEDVKIIDQFPQTEHFESCVLLSKLS